MGADLTLRTGPPGEHDKIVVEWFDETGEHHSLDIEVVMLDRDRPRTLEVRIDSWAVYRHVAGKGAYHPDSRDIPKDGL